MENSSNGVAKVSEEALAEINSINELIVEAAKQMEAARMHVIYRRQNRDNFVRGLASAMGVDLEQHTLNMETGTFEKNPQEPDELVE